MCLFLLRFGSTHEVSNYCASGLGKGERQESLNLIFIWGVLQLSLLAGRRWSSRSGWGFLSACSVGKETRGGKELQSNLFGSHDRATSCCWNPCSMTQSCSKHGKVALRRKRQRREEQSQSFFVLHSSQRSDYSSYRGGV